MMTAHRFHSLSLSFFYVFCYLFTYYGAINLTYIVSDVFNQIKIIDQSHDIVNEFFLLQ